MRLSCRRRRRRRDESAATSRTGGESMMSWVESAFPPRGGEAFPRVFAENSYAIPSSVALLPMCSCPVVTALQSQACYSSFVSEGDHPPMDPDRRRQLPGRGGMPGSLEIWILFSSLFVIVACVLPFLKEADCIIASCAIERPASSIASGIFCNASPGLSWKMHRFNILFVMLN